LICRLTFTNLSQVDLYNARDLDNYIALFSDDVVLEDLQTNALLLQGKAAIRGRYEERFKTPVHCTLLGRLAIGRVVRIDRLFPLCFDFKLIPFCSIPTSFA
jgi:hypothetical protein